MSKISKYFTKAIINYAAHLREMDRLRNEYELQLAVLKMISAERKLEQQAQLDKQETLL